MREFNSRFQRAIHRILRQCWADKTSSYTSRSYWHYVSWWLLVSSYKSMRIHRDKHRSYFKILNMKTKYGKPLSEQEQKLKFLNVIGIILKLLLDFVNSLKIMMKICIYSFVPLPPNRSQYQGNIYSRFSRHLEA